MNGTFPLLFANSRVDQLPKLFTYLRLTILLLLLLDLSFSQLFVRNYKAAAAVVAGVLRASCEKRKTFFVVGLISIWHHAENFKKMCCVGYDKMFCITMYDGVI
jgi:hypothetical protein